MTKSRKDIEQICDEGCKEEGHRVYLKSEFIDDIDCDSDIVYIFFWQCTKWQL